MRLPVAGHHQHLLPAHSDAWRHALSAAAKQCHKNPRSAAGRHPFGAPVASARRPPLATGFQPRQAAQRTLRHDAELTMEPASRSVNPLQGALLLALSALLFAFTGVGIREISVSVNNESVVFFRNLVGVLFFLPLLLVRRVRP